MKNVRYERFVPGFTRKELLNMVTSPAEVKEQPDMLSKAAAKLDAATQANKAASAASVWSGRLSEWEQNSNNESRVAA